MDAYQRGYRRAARHLIAAGLPVAPCLDELRALWRNSPEDRRLVAEILGQWESNCMTSVITEGAADQRPLRGDLWASRPVLQHIQSLARARMVGPYAVLAYMVAEAVATIPPYITLEPIIGGRGSLNMCIAITGRSGAGKGTAAAAARGRRDLLLPSRSRRPSPPSGPVKASHAPTGPGARPPTGPTQVTAAIFSAEEIDTWAAIASRSGSTLSAEVRKMFSENNSDSATRQGHPQRRRSAHLPRPGRRRRPTRAVRPYPRRRRRRLAATILVGTRIRSGRARRSASGAGALPRTERGWHLEVSSGNLPNGHLEIPDEARTVIVRARQAVLREEPDADPLAAHALLTRLKIAAGLMALDGRAWITVEDWHLAGELMEVSDSTRDRCRRALTDRSRRANTARALATVEREEIAAERRLARARAYVRKIDSRGQLTKNRS